MVLAFFQESPDRAKCLNLDYVSQVRLEKRSQNLGEQDAFWESDEGIKCKLVVQLSDVDRVLVAGTELADNGFETTLRKRDGLIKNIRTGKTIKIIRKGGVYVVRMWVNIPTTTPSDVPPFRRQGN